MINEEVIKKYKEYVLLCSDLEINDSKLFTIPCQIIRKLSEEAYGVNSAELLELCIFDELNFTTKEISNFSEEETKEILDGFIKERMIYENTLSKTIE